jgi:O-antigen/teichoic acid export membrane protein
MLDSLRKSGKKGMLWSFLIQGGTQVINFIVTVLLARLLLPEQFGLIGMIAVFIAISRALLDGGFISSLIRTKDVDNVDYSTVFFVNLISSLILYGLLFITAPFIADFYEEEILINIIRVLGVVLIINAFSLVQSAKLNKALQFKTQFKLQLPSLLISALVSIWMAYNDYGVWSLVAKDLIYAMLATIQLWWYAKWIPSFVFDKGKFKYHFNFGYKLSLTQIINTSFNNLYNVIIGKYFSAAQLGYFTRARSLEQLPTGFFYNAFNRVFYPLLSQINNDDQQLKRVYSQLMRLVVFIVTPTLVYLGVVAEPFFRWLLTEKWLPAVPYFQLLLISGIFFPIHQYNLNICKLKGRSDMVLKLSMLQNSLLLLGAFSAVWYGINGLLYSLIIVNILITLINAHFSGKLIDYGLKNQVKDLHPILTLNITLAVVFYILQITFFQELQDLWNLITAAMLFFTSYLGTAFLLKMRVTTDLLLYIKKN